MDCTISTYSEIDRLQYMYIYDILMTQLMYKKQSLKFIAMLTFVLQNLPNFFVLDSNVTFRVV